MAELQVPRLDFSALAELPQAYRQARNQTNSELTLAALGRGEITREQAATQLMASDPQRAMSLANLGNNERDYKFRESEAARAQQNTEASLALQKQQLAATNANTAAQQQLARDQFAFQKEQGLRPEIRSTKDDNGNDVFYTIDRRTNTAVPVNLPGRSGEANNPFLTGGAMNESQSKDALYANRMMNAERTFRDPKVIDAGMSMTQRGMNALGGVGNFMVSDQFQKYDQAKRDFINATLRRESGAVIADSEFANAEKQYFPRPGDSPEVLKQKQQNRIEAIKGIGAGGGKGYKPAYGFDQAGNIVERGQPQQAQQSSAVPQAAVAALQQNPALREQFDAKYGAGASARVLGQ